MNTILFVVLSSFCLVFAPLRPPDASPSPVIRPAENQAGPGSAQPGTTKQRSEGQQPEASSQEQVPNDPAEKEAERQQIRDAVEEGTKHVLVSQIEAWNHGNLAGYMNGYWHSPDLEFFSGATVTKGWQPTLERYQQRYASPGKEMGKLEFSELHIDVLSKRAAVVTGKWQLTMSDGKQPHGLFTLVFKKMNAGWKIVHDHSSGE